MGMTFCRVVGVVCCVGLSIQASIAAAGERLFQESETNFVNPERGFYSPRNTTRMTGLERLREQGISLVLVEMDLRAFKDRALTPEKLDELRAALTAARQAGLKVIFRAAYGFTDRDYRADPKDLDRILAHVRQIGAVLTENADTLFAVQAGFLGPWGEWHDSNWGDPPALDVQRATLFALLDSVPAPIPIQVRRPMFIRDIFSTGQGGSDSTNSAAFDGSRLSRVGWHDDAFLALPDDMGTYAEAGWDRERELRWCDQHDRYAPFGGETVGPSALTPIAQVVREMELLHLSFLNIAYHPKTLQHWRDSQYRGENAFGYIERRIGYRLSARKIRYSTDARAGGQMSFELTLTNDGFASPQLPRVVTVGLICGGRIERLPINNVDPRQWGPWSGNIIVRGQIPIPEDFDDTQTAQLAIQLADPSPRLRNDGRFAIRLANDGVPFLEKDGWNILAGDIAIHR
ncbi:MAG TPA: DUF4832 domain-containing protein [Candidatus Baltobacteraceae bacterium]|nr:DUF4832 domain-containing protein [Candidatus Baltobacteraceae bacterium]